MFMGCASFTAAPELQATTLADSCYRQMFTDCTSLITVPELPATTLANNCYRNMFTRCSSLTTAPSILPATTLVTECYRGMFLNCTSLVEAPELPATTLVTDCYYNMFSGCTSLNYIKAMFTTTPSTTYTNNWVQNVAANGTFIKSDSATWNVTGDNGVPSGWTLKSVGDPADNASIKIYYNFYVGTNSEITSVSTGNNLTLGVSGTWYYGNNKYVVFSRNNSRYSTVMVKLSLVITGFTQFKCVLSGNTQTSSTTIIGLSNLNYNDTINSGQIQSNSNIAIYKGNNSYDEYIYTGLNQDTKYLISIYIQSNGNCNPKILVPSSYPNFTLVNNYFDSSSDYTDIFG